MPGGVNRFFGTHLGSFGNSGEMQPIRALDFLVVSRYPGGVLVASQNHTRSAVLLGFGSITPELPNS